MEHLYELCVELHLFISWLIWENHDTFSRHIFNVLLQHICHVADDTEDDQTGEDTSDRVQDRNNDGIPTKQRSRNFQALHQVLVTLIKELAVF